LDQAPSAIEPAEQALVMLALNFTKRIVLAIAVNTQACIVPLDGRAAKLDSYALVLLPAAPYHNFSGQGWRFPQMEPFHAQPLKSLFSRS
jgi:hypothetical protein